MQVPRIVIDGLWRCICPSIDSFAFPQSSPSLRRGSIRLALRTTKGPLSRPSSSLLVHGKASIKLQGRGYGTATEECRRTLSTTANAVPTLTLSNASLDAVPLANLHDKLRNRGVKNGTYKSISDLVEYLIKSRKETPSLLHYDALIRANADASKGSADAVANLLQEVKEENIIPDSSLCHGALQALAVHPDHLLRSAILREMKDRWYTLTNEGWHHLVVGLLRDRQYEIALDKLEQMHQQGVQVDKWLYDIFIYLFCEAGELDEALKLLTYRVDHGDMDISANVWYYMLDACSTLYHYDGTQYVWRKRVETEYIHPSDGLCINVLNTAARHHDPNLATDVVRVLASRTSRLDIHHYEALIAAYARSPDLKTPMQILSIMKKARLEPSDATTRPIYENLCRAKNLPFKAFLDLQTLAKDGEPIPIAAVNVIIEASVAHGNLKEAIKQYKSLHEICPSGPNTATFNALLRGGSKKSGNKDLAMFLASEMSALGIRPDVLTYDRLVLVCLLEQDYEDAFLYLEEMKIMIEGSRLRAGTLNVLIGRCVEAGDKRLWSILEDMRRRGHSLERSRRWAEKAWMKVWNGAIPSSRDGWEGLASDRRRGQIGDKPYSEE